MPARRSMAVARALGWGSRLTTYAFVGAGTGVILKNHVVDVTPINGKSMNPTLSPNTHETGQRDWILWQMWKPREKVKPGDIVLFLCPSDPETSVVKRVIATGGDIVTLDPKRQPGYGKILDDLRPEDVAAAERWHAWHGRLTVPYGHIWVEGDNWRVTRDSNDYGPVSKSLIIGKGWMAIWPLDILFTKPWVGYQSKTKVKGGIEEMPDFWAE